MGGPGLHGGLGAGQAGWAGKVPGAEGRSGRYLERHGAQGRPGVVSEHQIRPAEPGPGRISAPGSQGPRSPRPTVPISWEALLAVLWPFVPCIGVLAPPQPRWTGGIRPGVRPWWGRRQPWGGKAGRQDQLASVLPRKQRAWGSRPSCLRWDAWEREAVLPREA